MFVHKTFFTVESSGEHDSDEELTETDGNKLQVKIKKEILLLTYKFLSVSDQFSQLKSKIKKKKQFFIFSYYVTN